MGRDEHEDDSVEFCCAKCGASNVTDDEDNMPPGWAVLGLEDGPEDIYLCDGCVESLLSDWIPGP